MSSDQAFGRRCLGSLGGPGVFLASLLLYLRTAAPDVTLIDSGDLIAAATALGNAHSPGYPGWILAAKACLFLPLGSLAFRANLFSAVTAGLAVWLLYAFSERFLRPASPLISAAAALAFAASSTFWSQAVMAEVYALAAIVMLLLSWLTLSWWERRPTVADPRPLLALAFLAGLGLGVHQMIAFLAPAILGLILWTEWRALLLPRRLLRLLLCFLFGYSVQLYLPLRAAQHPAYVWENPTNLSATWGVLTTRTFLDQRFVRSGEQFLAHFGNFLHWTADQYGPWLLFLPLLGALVLLRRRPRLALFLLVIGVVDALIATTNFNLSAQWFFTLHVFFIPAYLVLALFLAVGLDFVLGEALRRLPGKALARLAMLAACGLLVAAPLLRHRAEVAMRDQHLVADWGRSVLRPLAPRAVVVVEEDELFVLGALQTTELTRPDVAAMHFLTLTIPGNWMIPWLKEQRPDLTFPEPPPGPPTAVLAQTLEQFLARNAMPVYLTFYDPSLFASSVRYRVEGLTLHAFVPGQGTPPPRDWTWRMLPLSRLLGPQGGIGQAEQDLRTSVRRLLALQVEALRPRDPAGAGELSALLESTGQKAPPG